MWSKFSSNMLELRKIVTHSGKLDNGIPQTAFWKKYQFYSKTRNASNTRVYLYWLLIGALCIDGWLSRKLCLYKCCLCFSVTWIWVFHPQKYQSVIIVFQLCDSREENYAVHKHFMAFVSSYIFNANLSNANKEEKFSSK